MDKFSDQFTEDMPSEELGQIEEFVRLLIELQIIEPPEGFFPKKTDNSEEVNDSSPINIPETNIFTENLFPLLNQSDTEKLDDFEAVSNEEFNQRLIALQNQYSAEQIIDYLNAQIYSYEDSDKNQSDGSYSEQLNQNISDDNSDIKSREALGSENNPEDAIIAFQKLQDILIGSEVDELKDITTQIKQNLNQLEHQIYDSESFIDLVEPWITEVLKLNIDKSREEIIEFISPIFDEIMQGRLKNNKIGMGTAFSPVVTEAISQQVNIDPDKVAQVLAPTMGRAIKKQVELEKDSIIDALYPVIGNTIAKYMVEMVRAINEKIENALSAEGIKRKIRARLQGVSEAELIVQESLYFQVEAIFLIQKSSGIVISELQRSDGQRLDSEMVAGMLTAIRNFANHCFAQAEMPAELDAIDYGSYKIVLEVAGYCYLAIVLQGEPSKEFIKKMRESLVKIIRNYGNIIQEFDGNSEIVPPQITTVLEPLQYKDAKLETEKRKTPPWLFILGAVAFTAVAIPWGMWKHQRSIIQRAENSTALALASTPELAVYRLTVQEHQGKLKLIGKLPNDLLRKKAAQVAQTAVPKWKIDNQILAVDVPPDPVLAAAEVQRITGLLNRVENMAIYAQYTDGKVIIEGIVSRNSDGKKIIQAFEKIPGVKSISSAVRVQPLRIEVRFYFYKDSATLNPADFGYKLQQVKYFLSEHPKKGVRIIGYSYSLNPSQEIKDLALNRAKAVQSALIKAGVDPSRLEVAGRNNLPPGIDMSHPGWLKRCVLLEPVDR
ncbi:hypothetical protein B6N60_01898 [Richelia sinica FACHB-800]|uniref:OmpA-like domain-containing protein n=1 Tax=Richelia sinica FACHB-800 TaxID=1357546 RepID=A0A975T6U6_9NOST|nr:OmpA family protein [Richelia sinica]MBD2664692.1 OmpA family protein [Richelia sinica FACHB-800]QXE23209.1 hypothetical protein B6N60_01898 [Richelia sinica FACHB-800]